MVIPEPRGLGKNGCHHDDLYSRISINSKFGVFWSLSTILPGTPLSQSEYLTNETTLERVSLDLSFSRGEISKTQGTDFSISEKFYIFRFLLKNLY